MFYIKLGRLSNGMPFITLRPRPTSDPLRCSPVSDHDSIARSEAVVHPGDMDRPSSGRVRGPIPPDSKTSPIPSWRTERKWCGWRPFTAFCFQRETGTPAKEEELEVERFKRPA